MSASILFIDGFDHYTAPIVDDKWTGPTTTLSTSTVTGRVLNANRNVFGIKYTIDAKSNLTIGAFRLSSIVGAGNLYQLCIGPTTNPCAFVIFASDGAIVAYDNTGLEVGRSEKAVSTESVGDYIELATIANNVSGELKVRVNGEEVISLTGLDTSTTITEFSVAGTGGGTSTWYDDFYASTETGSGMSFIGDIKVYTLYPTGAGNYTEWTGTPGANWANVDESSTSLLDYNTSTAVDQIDSFACSNLSFTGEVKYVQIVLYADQPDEEINAITGFCRIDGVDYVHPNPGTVVTIAEKFYTFGWNLSPATGVAWTVSEVNGAEFGYKITVAGSSINVYQCVIEVAGIADSVAQVFQAQLEAIGINLSEAKVTQALVELLTEPSECTCPDPEGNFMY